MNHVLLVLVYNQLDKPLNRLPWVPGLLILFFRQRQKSCSLAEVEVEQGNVLRGTTIIGGFHAGTAVRVGPLSDLLCVSLCISLALIQGWPPEFAVCGCVSQKYRTRQPLRVPWMTAFKADANACFSPIVKRAKDLSPLSVSDLVLFRDEVINREDILKISLFILLRVFCKVTTM